MRITLGNSGRLGRECAPRAGSRSLMLIAMLVLAGLLAPACNEPDSPPVEKRRKVRIGFVIPGRDDSDHIVYIGATSAAAKDHPDVELDVRFSEKNSPVD